MPARHGATEVGHAVVRFEPDRRIVIEERVVPPLELLEVDAAVDPVNGALGLQQDGQRQLPLGTRGVAAGGGEGTPSHP